MVDLNAAFHDAKYLSDDDLQKELQNPSGLIPDYIVMSEIQDRQAIRSSTQPGGKRMSMKDELLSSMPQQQPMPQNFSRGGLIASINPFQTMVKAMRNPEMMGGLMQEALNNSSGGLPSLQAAQAPQAPPMLADTSNFIPQQPGTPAQPQQYSTGGLASLRR